MKFKRELSYCGISLVLAVIILTLMCQFSPNVNSGIMPSPSIQKSNLYDSIIELEYYLKENLKSQIKPKDKKFDKLVDNISLVLNIEECKSGEVSLLAIGQLKNHMQNISAQFAKIRDHQSKDIQEKIAKADIMIINLINLASIVEINADA